MKTLAIMCQHPVMVTLQHTMQYIAIRRLLYVPNFNNVSSTSILDIPYSPYTRNILQYI